MLINLVCFLFNKSTIMILLFVPSKLLFSLLDISTSTPWIFFRFFSSFLLRFGRRWRQTIFLGVPHFLYFFFLMGRLMTRFLPPPGRSLDCLLPEPGFMPQSLSSEHCYKIAVFKTCRSGRQTMDNTNVNSFSCSTGKQWVAHHLNAFFVG